MSMGFILFILLILLSLSLFLSLYKKGPLKRIIYSFRILTVVLGVAFFTYWFVEKSLDKFMKNAIGLQLINELPQPLDFYIITVEKKDGEKVYQTEHLGKLRTDHYRINYLKMANSNEYWVVGYLGKNLSYFSAQFVPNKSMDQIVNVNNYTVESEQLSEIAKLHVDDYRSKDLRTAVRVTLVLLLLFLNIGWLMTKDKGDH